jgi:hypothetical protein
LAGAYKQAGARLALRARIRIYFFTGHRRKIRRWHTTVDEAGAGRPMAQALAFVTGE